MIPLLHGYRFMHHLFTLVSSKLFILGCTFINSFESCAHSNALYNKENILQVLQEHIFPPCRNHLEQIVKAIITILLEELIPRLEVATIVSICLISRLPTESCFLDLKLPSPKIRTRMDRTITAMTMGASITVMAKAMLLTLLQSNQRNRK